MITALPQAFLDQYPHDWWPAMLSGQLRVSPQYAHGQDQEVES